MDIKHFLNNKSGFSLIELLVVIFIIALISGSVAVSSWQGQNQSAAAGAAQKLAVDLRRAQIMALSGKLQGEVAPSGYGLYSAGANQYYIFYNINVNDIDYQSSSAIIETINLDKASLSPVGSSIFFAPPDPKTYINGASSGSQTFTLLSGGSAKNVVIYATGIVDIN